jgi:hypothetical protein
MTEEERSRVPFPFLLGIVIIALLVAGLVLLTRKPQTAGPAEKPLPMTAVEQAYAAHIQFQDLQMSRAANFLNQEVTYVFCTVSNEGARTLREMEVTIEFRDVFNQVVLLEKRRLLGPHDPPLAASQKRELQLTFEHVPDLWNRRYPSLRVTGLLLE